MGSNNFFLLAILFLFLIKEYHTIIYEIMDMRGSQKKVIP
jgi:hypothetical protein